MDVDQARHEQAVDRPEAAHAVGDCPLPPIQAIRPTSTSTSMRHEASARPGT